MKKLLILVVSTLFFTANAQDKEVKITIDPLSDHIYMLTVEEVILVFLKTKKDCLS